MAVHCQEKPAWDDTDVALPGKPVSSGGPEREKGTPVAIPFSLIGLIEVLSGRSVDRSRAPKGQPPVRVAASPAACVSSMPRPCALRIRRSISSATAPFSLRKFLAFSRPWPMRSSP